MTSQQIQHGGRLPHWKSFFGYISTTYRPINATFGKTFVFRYMSRDKNIKFRKIKMANGRYVFFSLYRSRESSDFNEIWCANANFGSNNSHVAKYQISVNPIWRPAAILKISFLGISQRFGQTPQTDADSKFQDPHISDKSRRDQIAVTLQYCCTHCITCVILWCHRPPLLLFIMRPSSLRRGPHSASHSVCLSVCPSVCLSVRAVIVFVYFFYSRIVLRANIQNRKTSVFAYGPASRTVFTFRHPQRAAYIVRPSRPHKLV